MALVWCRVVSVVSQCVHKETTAREISSLYTYPMGYSIKTKTARKIEDLVDSVRRHAVLYSGDLKGISYHGAPLLSLSLPQFFDYVKKSGRYEMDDTEKQVVARPAYIVALSGAAGRDCKKCAVMMGAYFEQKKKPWRLVTISTRNDKRHHHIFTQFFDGEHWKNCDATFSKNRIAEPQKVTDYKYYEVKK